MNDPGVGAISPTSLASRRAYRGEVTRRELCRTTSKPPQLRELTWRWLLKSEFPTALRTPCRSDNCACASIAHNPPHLGTSGEGDLVWPTSRAAQLNRVRKLVLSSSGPLSERSSCGREGKRKGKLCADQRERALSEVENHKLPDQACPVLIGWDQIGAYLGVTAETARARHNRGDFAVGKPVRWNMPIVTKASLNEALLDIAGRAKTRSRD